jgi:hypothetical protein
MMRQRFRSLAHAFARGRSGARIHRRAQISGRLALAFLVGTLGVVLVPGVHASAAAPKALIFGPTVSGSPSLEQQDLQSQGWTVTVVNGAAWAAMSAAQFASYQLLVFGDPSCGSNPAILQPAVTNESTWAPIVDGSVIIIGTDPVFHNGGHPGAGKLVSKGLAYAGSQSGKTGLYIDLSCYYGFGQSNVHVPILDGFEAGFRATSPGCADAIHIVATAPELVGLTDADLSNWSCSLHEYLNAWPTDFVPIAIDTSAAPAYTAPDGTKGTPYVLGRGSISAGSVALTGPLASAAINTSQTLTVTVELGGSPVNGAVVTLTAVSGPNAAATTTVTTNAAGTATYSYTSAAVGTDTWTATYTPAGRPTQTSAQAAVVWTQASTTFTASATPPTVAYGTSSTLSESGLQGAATGTVTFSSGGLTLCTATLPATNCTTSTSLTAGVYPITATYSGDSNYTGSTASTSLTVTAAATTFTAGATPSTIPFGTSSTLAESGLAADASGTVTFSSGASTLCTATLPVTSCATSTTLSAGNYPVTATYSGDNNYAGSAASTTLTVTFTVSATPPNVVYGTSSSLAESGLPGSATGVVTFTSGATTLCIATLPATSCLTSTTLPAGTYAVTATYSGDVNNPGSTTSTSLTVTLAATSFAATATPPSVSYGVSSTLGQSGLAAGATGTITFTAGALTLCSVTLPATTCTTSNTLAASSYPVTATYSGDANHSGSTASTNLTVTPAVTTTTVTSSQNPAGPNQLVPYTALVGPNPGSGTVAFTDNGVAMSGCGAVPIDPATGKATCSTTYPRTGSHTIGATYSGNANYQPSAAATSGVQAFTESVQAAVGLPTAGVQGPAMGLGRDLRGAIMVLFGLIFLWRAKRTDWKKP